MKMTMMMLTFSAVLVAPFACVDLALPLGGTTGCDFREDSVNGPEPRCQERNGVQGGDTFASVCKGLEGEAIDGGCPDAGKILGCQLQGDGTVIDWYYAPKTVAEVEMDCANEGTVVQP